MSVRVLCILHLSTRATNCPLPFSFSKFLVLKWEFEEEGVSVGAPFSSWCTLAFTGTVSSASSAVVVSYPLMSSQLSCLLFLAFLPG